MKQRYFHAWLELAFVIILFAILLFTMQDCSGQGLQPGNGSGGGGGAGVTNLVTANANGLMTSNLFRVLTNAVQNLTNLIPVGARYSSTQDPNATANFGAGPVYYYWTNLNPSVTYLIVVPGQGFANDIGIASDTNGLSDLANATGFFQPLHSTCEVFGSAANSLIGLMITPVYTNTWLYGYFNGTFDGLLTSNSVVPDSCLGSDVILRYGQFNGPLYCTPTNTVEHYIANHGSTDGSLMWLMKADHHGYCDLGFFTKNSDTIPPQAGLDLTSTLRFTFGAGVQNTNQFPYNQPYCEMYSDVEPFYFVGNNHIWGGFTNAPNNLGDWVWFKTGTNDVMFKISTEDNANISFYQLNCHSNITAPSITITNTATVNNLTINGTVTSANTISNCTATAGSLIATGLTSSMAAVMLYTNSSAARTYITVHVSPVVTTSDTAGTLTVTISYTDQTGAHTATPVSVQNTTSTGKITAVPFDLTIAPGTGVTISTTQVNTTGTATIDLAGWVIR